MPDITLFQEVIQARLLVELMGNAVHKELVLKGGLAMRAVHGSVRHTKDIDLDAGPAFSKERIHGLVARSIARVVNASRLIDNPVVTEPKMTATTLRWKINGTMPGSSLPIHLTVEVSRRESLMRDLRDHVIEAKLSNDFAPGAEGATVRVLDSQAIAVTKVMALTDPHRLAPRDLYDLHILIQANIPAPTHLLASLPKERLEAAFADLWTKIEMMTYRQFQQEVMPSLPPPVRDSLDEDAYADMQLQVGERVEKWLAGALEPPDAGPPTLGAPLLGGARPGDAGTNIAATPVPGHAARRARQP